ncbi:MULTISPECIES: type II toxin-antitoxin system ParD family antitoxin [unclassified Sphingomonas]|uniref:ribbon-helix-helix domain-containing protein n=1 Tax=unclassified Sphingomonas TaxID=196159 RepID=UPI0025E0D4F8|nr:MULTISPECIES: type II toxin-antitoxin system ParD family antitoxin [unclassified Sphingomonas]
MWHTSQNVVPTFVASATRILYEIFYTQDMPMCNDAQITVVVPYPIATTIHAAVRTGEYASTSEVVCDAVRLWSERRASRAKELIVLRAAWDSGKASGIAGPLDMTAIIAEAKSEAGTSR